MKEQVIIRILIRLLIIIDSLNGALDQQYPPQTTFYYVYGEPMLRINDLATFPQIYTQPLPIFLLQYAKSKPRQVVFAATLQQKKPTGQASPPYFNHLVSGIFTMHQIKTQYLSNLNQPPYQLKELKPIGVKREQLSVEECQQYFKQAPLSKQGSLLSQERKVVGIRNVLPISKREENVFVKKNIGDVSFDQDGNSGTEKQKKKEKKLPPRLNSDREGNKIFGNRKKLLIETDSQSGQIEQHEALLQKKQEKCERVEEKRRFWASFKTQETEEMHQVSTSVKVSQKTNNKSNKSIGEEIKQKKVEYGKEKPKKGKGKMAVNLVNNTKIEDYFKRK